MNKKISVTVSRYLILNHWNANKWILDGDVMNEIVIEIINEIKRIIIILFFLIINFDSSTIIYKQIKNIINIFKKINLI